MTRVDGHVHAFPDRLALAVRERLNGMGGLTASPLLPAVAQRVLDEGFDAAWILPYAHRAGVAESVNEWSAAEVAAYPWLVAGATFHPADEDLPRLVERALVELGLRVVKLHCSVGAFSPSDPRLEPLWDAAEALSVPVVTHAGQVSPGMTSEDEMDELVPVLRRHPRLRLILAHSGLPATTRTLQLMSEHEGLYADLTPVGAQPVDIGVDELVRFGGRFLFGSDAPNNPTPASDQARRLEAMRLPSETVESIMGDAALSLVPDVVLVEGEAV